MNIVFVQRETDSGDTRFGKVKGVYARRQDGYAEEELSDGHPDVAEYNEYVLSPQRMKPSIANGALADLLVAKGFITDADIVAAIAGKG